MPGTPLRAAAGGRRALKLGPAARKGGSDGEGSATDKARPLLSPSHADDESWDKDVSKRGRGPGSGSGLPGGGETRTRTPQQAPAFPPPPPPL